MKGFSCLPGSGNFMLPVTGQQSMTDKENKPQPKAPAGKDRSQKTVRDERLKKSLRANLQRRKAKMRALKASDEESDQD
jgi:hypothetical protein